MGMSNNKIVIVIVIVIVINNNSIIINNNNNSECSNLYAFSYFPLRCTFFMGLGAKSSKKYKN